MLKQTKIQVPFMNFISSSGILHLMTAVAMFLMDGKLSNLKTMDELRALVNDIKFGNSKGKGK